MKSLVISLLSCLLIVENRFGISTVESSGCAGAVYTMSNAALNNQVFIFCLNTNGQLTNKKTINTNGAGVSTAASGPLASQGSMVVYTNYLFVVNAGSDTLSMFSINTDDPTQLTLISMQPTNGCFPVSVTANSKYACVVTSGSPAGLRCFRYNIYGLYVVPPFDRTLPLPIAQTNPPHGPLGTVSQISFSPDGLALIVTVKGYNTTMKGYLLFYQFTNSFTTLSSAPVKQTPTGAIGPCGMTLLGTNGLLIADLAANGVQTLNYTSTSGAIQNSALTTVNASTAGQLCGTAYSPMIKNYYGIGTNSSAIVELNLNLLSTSKPVNIVQYYPISANVGALDVSIATVFNTDFLFVIGVKSQVITVYRLAAAGKAAFLQQVIAQADSPTTPRLAGMATYVC